MIFKDTLLQKRENLIKKGIEPYPYSYEITHKISEIKENQEKLIEKETVSIAGRVTALRRQGKKVFFADIEDFYGKIQIYLKKQTLDKKDEKIWESVLNTDIGDWIGTKGKVFKTKTGELTIWSEDFKILSKIVIPVPISKEKGEKQFSKLADKETLYRQRYLHWITDRKAREVVILRAKIISFIRKFMEQRGFLEVLTPTIDTVYGGATARPFETTVFALSNEKAYLRISPEIALKKFIVGGFPKVYTICQNFRNEGIDRSHNPEFTMMEWYEAFTDYNYQMRQFEELVSSVIKEIKGDYKIKYTLIKENEKSEEIEIDFTPPWKRMTFFEALKKLGNIEAEKMTDEELIKKAKEIDPKFTPPIPFSRGHVIDFLFKHLCEEKLIQPTFILDHPISISPLTKKKRGNPELVERFEPFVLGMEIGNAYSELTDPVDQLERFKNQRKFDADNIKKEGFVNHPIDMDFIRALGMGMPPTGGVGLGIDRLVMIITNQPSIRDVIPFPLMKRKEEDILLIKEITEKNNQKT